MWCRSAAGMSCATVNLKPFSPGHVLVVPCTGRPVATLAELSTAESADLWRSVATVQVNRPAQTHTVVCRHRAVSGPFADPVGRGRAVTPQALVIKHYGAEGAMLGVQVRLQTLPGGSLLASPPPCAAAPPLLPRL